MCGRHSGPVNLSGTLRDLIPAVNASSRNSTLKVMVTTRALMQRIRPITLFKDFWKEMVQSQISELKNGEVWRKAFEETVITYLWIFGSILIICSSGLWAPATAFPGLSISINALLHTLMFALYIFGFATRESLIHIHLNPAITFMTMCTGLTGPAVGLVNMLGQCVGSILASLSAKELIPKYRRDSFLLGGCYIRRTVLVNGVSGTLGFSNHQGFLAEFLFSFSFLYATYLINNPKQLKIVGLRLAVFLVCFSIGFNMYLSATIHPGYGGSIFNPARCLGPAIAYGQPLWDQLWIPFLAPFVAAAAVASLILAIPSDHVEVYATKQDILSKIRRSLPWGKQSELVDNENTVYDAPSLPGESSQTSHMQQLNGVMR